MEQYIRNRLEYVEETFAGEMETWVDPVTNTYSVSYTHLRAHET